MSEIADKIRKLIAKAQATTNPHEAAAFMNKATELMAANGLTMEAVDLAAIKEGSIKSKFSVSKPKAYEMTLMQAIAVSFGCELLWQESRSWQKYGAEASNYAAVIFVGPKDRIELAVYAGEVLGRQLFKARLAYSQKQSDVYWQIAANQGWDTVEQCKKYADGEVRQMIREQVKREADSFAMGWAMEIQKKVAKFSLNDREQQLIGQYVHNKCADEDGNLNAAKNEKIEMSYGSMLQGQQAAKDAHLHRPVGTDGAPTNLLGETKQLR